MDRLRYLQRCDPLRKPVPDFFLKRGAIILPFDGLNHGNNAFAKVLIGQAKYGNTGGQYDEIAAFLKQIGQ